MHSEPLTHELKFEDPLAVYIADGLKHSTWRLDNDRDMQQGDMLRLIHKSTLRLFGIADITEVNERTFATLTPDDYAGHEPFSSEAHMTETYSRYYGRPIGMNTPLTVVKFSLRLLCSRPGDDETDIMIISGNAA